MTPAPRTILVVDDDPDVREALRETLEYEGYVAVEAANGQEALDWVRSNGAPCLVLLDLMMPVLNGHQFLEAVGRDRTLEPVSVLILSAAAKKEVELAAKSSRAVGVLSKPIQLEALLRAVAQHC